MKSLEQANSWGQYCRDKAVEEAGSCMEMVVWVGRGGTGTIHGSNVSFRWENIQGVDTAFRHSHLKAASADGCQTLLGYQNGG